MRKLEKISDDCEVLCILSYKPSTLPSQLGMNFYLISDRKYKNATFEC